jgi:hypothetical protein
MRAVIRYAPHLHTKRHNSGRNGRKQDVRQLPNRLPHVELLLLARAGSGKSRWRPRPEKKTGAFAPAIAPPGLEPRATFWVSRRPPEVNQDSPDPDLVRLRPLP